MKHIIVLAGGNSDERDVSLRSGSAVTATLSQLGYTVTQLDPGVGLEKLLPQLKTADAVFPALHGLGGEDGTLQTFLDDHIIPYVGSATEACDNTFFKQKAHRILSDNSIATPLTELVDYEQFQTSKLATRPFVLKPDDGGSSIDTIIVRDPKNYDTTAVADVFTRHKQMILQQFIVGTEITVAIVDEKALPVIEIVPPENGEFNYENKYNGATLELCPPRSVSEELQKNAQELALKVYRVFGCRDMSRIDILIASDGKMYVIDINTIPGLTDQSLLPKAALAAGMNMSLLCDRLVQMALARKSDF